jgi:hypothetical protein
MHRPTVGIITLVLLAAALLAPIVGGQQAAVWQSACLRVAILMGTLWLALPVLKGVRPLWAILGLVSAVAALVIAAKHPLAISLVAIIALLLGYLSVGWRARGRR